jgi:hypothetical protein
MGSAADANTYQTIPINVSFEFGPTPGNILTADTGNLSATTTSITAIADAFDLYTVFSASPNNIGLTAGTGISLTNPTPLTPGAAILKSFTTPVGAFSESLNIVSFSFTAAGFAAGAATAGTSSLVTPATLVVTATGTISFTGEESGTTGLGPTGVFYAATYTQLPGGPINALIVDTTVPLPAALPLFATGIGGLGLLGWRRKRKAQAVA